MRLNNTMTITKRSVDGAFYGEKNGVPYVIDNSHSDYNDYESLYNTMRATAYSNRPDALAKLMKENRFPSIANSKLDEAKRRSRNKKKRKERRRPHPH